MSWKERLRMAWRVLTHKSRGHEFWGCVQITEEGWAQRGDAFTEPVRNECQGLARDMRRRICAEKQKEFRFEEI